MLYPLIPGSLLLPSRAIIKSPHLPFLAFTLFIINSLTVILCGKSEKGEWGLEEHDLSAFEFTVLTGRNGVLSRTTLFRWVKSCRKSFALRFYDLTRPLSDFAGEKLKSALISTCSPSGHEK